MPTERLPDSLQNRAVDGEVTVTISYEEYVALRCSRLAVEEWKARCILNEDNGLGLFAHDAEVAIFLSVRFGLMTAREVVAEIERRFGEERKPTVAEVKRFWLRFRNCMIPKGGN